MISYGKETRLSAEQVIERSVRFFGPDGVGLDVVERGSGCARFEGGGGYVSIACCEGEKGTRVDLESREWEYQAGQFVGKL